MHLSLQLQTLGATLPYQLKGLQPNNLKIVIFRKPKNTFNYLDICHKSCFYPSSRELVLQAMLDTNLVQVLLIISTKKSTESIRVNQMVSQVVNQHLHRNKCFIVVGVIF